MQFLAYMAQLGNGKSMCKKAGRIKRKGKGKRKWKEDCSQQSTSNSLSQVAASDSSVWASAAGMVLKSDLHWIHPVLAPVPSNLLYHWINFFHHFFPFCNKSSALLSLDLHLRGKCWNHRTITFIIPSATQRYPKVSDQPGCWGFMCSTAPGTAVIFCTLHILRSLYFAKTQHSAFWNSSKIHWWLGILSASFQILMFSCQEKKKVAAFLDTFCREIFYSALSLCFHFLCKTSPK